MRTATGLDLASECRDNRNKSKRIKIRRNETASCGLSGFRLVPILALYPLLGSSSLMPLFLCGLRDKTYRVQLCHSRVFQRLDEKIKNLKSRAGFPPAHARFVSRRVLGFRHRDCRARPDLNSAYFPVATSAWFNAYGIPES